ncbi:hypothetical protein BZA77DRAFT_78059 [Pyronema omphalodes]|nr:hypothetical protein BZA77DRAFT_78059 [Pyronema omphalodes]
MSLLFISLSRSGVGWLAAPPLRQLFSSIPAFKIRLLMNDDTPFDKFRQIGISAHCIESAPQIPAMDVMACPSQSKKAGDKVSELGEMSCMYILPQLMVFTPDSTTTSMELHPPPPMVYS